MDVAEIGFGNMAQAADIPSAAHGPKTRPPTVAEAASILKQNEHCPEYCLACLRHWRAIVEADVADAMEARAPESVRKWINERRLSR